MRPKPANIFLFGKLLVLGLLQANSAQGAILFDSSTNISLTDNFWNKDKFGGLPASRETFFAFDEEQNVTLTENLGVQDSTADNTIDNFWDDLSLTEFIPSGTTVSSSLIFLRNTDESEGFNLTGTAKFDKPILGVYGDFDLFRDFNSLFAPDALNSGPGVKASLEGIQQKTLPADLVTLVDPYTINLDWTLKSSTDALRVITLEDESVTNVPEPATILGTLMFLGFGTLFKLKSFKSKILQVP